MFCVHKKNCIAFFLDLSRGDQLWQFPPDSHFFLKMCSKKALRFDWGLSQNVSLSTSISCLVCLDSYNSKACNFLHIFLLQRDLISSSIFLQHLRSMLLLRGAPLLEEFTRKTIISQYGSPSGPSCAQDDICCPQSCPNSSGTPVHISVPKDWTKHACFWVRALIPACQPLYAQFLICKN